MYKYLFIMLIISVCIGQDEWIYYNYIGGAYRAKPDYSEVEIFNNKQLSDMSEDQETFLFTNNNGFIYLMNNDVVDSMDVVSNFYYTRLTQSINEIIYYKPSNSYNLDQIFKYSFLDNSTTIIADSIYRFANYNPLMSPSRDRLVYFKSVLTNPGYYQLFVVDIQSGDETYLTTIQNNINMFVPPHYYWAMDDFIYLNIHTDESTQLYKIHSSNSDIPLEQVTQIDTSLGLLGSHNTNLDKLLLASSRWSESLSDLWIYELETSELKYIGTIQGEYVTTQTWSEDNLKVAIGSKLGLWDPYTAIQIYDVVNDTIFSIPDSAKPLFWLGGQDLDIKNSLDVMPSNYFLSQNFPNPFNPVTTLKYDLLKNGLVNITIYDILGNVINQLVNEVQNSGFKSVQWNATNNQGQPVSAGVYLYSIEAGDFRQTKKMILLK